MRRWMIVATLLPLLPLLPGCKRDEPSSVRRYACRCDFLTDMDDASEQRVEVCAADPTRAQEMAVGCAQSGAPATVQRCACEPASGAACKAGDCRVLQFR